MTPGVSHRTQDNAAERPEQAPRRGFVRDLLISLSLVNLLHLLAWQEMNSAYTNSLNYYRDDPPRLVLLGALVLSELALAGILALAMSLVRRWENASMMRVAQWAFLGTLCLSVEIVRRNLVDVPGVFVYPALANVALVALEILILLGCILLLFRMDFILRIGLGVTLALSPLALVSTFYVVATIPSKGAFAAKPGPCLDASDASAPRIIWLVFDELDQRYSLELRPPSVDMPALGRLGRETIQANRVRAAGADTLSALASLICGRIVDRAVPEGERDLLIGFKGSPALVRWSEQPNIFKQVRELGLGLGMVGWYHPYARVFPGLFCEVAWRPNTDSSPLAMRQEYAASSGWVPAVRDQLLRDLLFLPLPGGIGERLNRHLATAEMDLLRRRNRDDFVWLRRRALQMAADPRLGFLFIHLPIPHPLGIYNRHHDEITLDRSSNYFDNLELVDVTIRDLRAAMENAGQWDKTVVFVTSDHGLRPRVWNFRPTWTPEEKAVTSRGEDRWVPFFLKLSRQKEGIAFDGEFNAITMHQMTLAIARGEIGTVSNALAWLERSSAPREGLQAQNPDMRRGLH